MEFIGKEINNCYRVKDKIGDNILCRVYKMEGLFSPIRVVMKIFKKENSRYQLEEIVRFKQKVMGIYNVNHPNVVKVFELDEIEGHLYVIMEYVKGATIREFLDNGNSLNYKDIIEIIISICNGLDASHRSGAIHKNLNLQNILIPSNKEFTNVKITNFGFADLLFPYHGNDADFIDSILCFLPPEACNIFSKNMDERSDLFSLGVIFYYLLTGKLPFESTSKEGYFRNIINNKIILPSKISSFVINGILDKIILKLLNAEKKNRYQNAESLLNDLEQVRMNDFDFEPGVNYLTFDSNFEIDTVDRENEHKILIERLSNVLSKKGEICLINGVVGIGKTKVTEELKKIAFKNNCIFIETGAEPTGVKRPFSIFNSFFNDYCNYFNKMEKKVKDKFVEKFSSEFSTKYGIFLKQFEIMDINENLKKIKIEKYFDLFTEFFFDIIEERFPLAILIKNIQWLDEDSIIVLKKIHGALADKNILIIYTYNSDYKRTSFINDLINNKNIHKIFLDKFNRDNTRKIVRDILREKRIDIPEILIDFIQDNSDGIPYYAIESLRQLINNEIIFPVMENWEIDIAKLKKINWKSRKDVILNKIQLLKNYELNVLYYSAIMETGFYIDSLLSIMDINNGDIITAVDYLVNQNVLNFKFSNGSKKYFINDIVKSIANTKVNKKANLYIHEKIARHNEVEYAKNKKNNYLFLTAYHYLRAENNQKALKYLLKLGKYFMEIYGYNESSNCYKTALRLIDGMNNKDKGALIKKVTNNLEKLRKSSVFEKK